MKVAKLSLFILVLLMSGCSTEPAPAGDTKEEYKNTSSSTMDEEKQQTTEAQVTYKWSSDTINFDNGYVTVFYTNTRKKIEGKRAKGQFITFKVIARNFEETIKNEAAYQLKLDGQTYDVLGYKDLPLDSNENTNGTKSYEKIMVWFEIPKTAIPTDAELYYYENIDKFYVWHK